MGGLERPETPWHGISISIASAPASASPSSVNQEPEARHPPPSRDTPRTRGRLGAPANNPLIRYPRAENRRPTTQPLALSRRPICAPALLFPLLFNLGPRSYPGRTGWAHPPLGNRTGAVYPQQCFPHTTGHSLYDVGQPASRPPALPSLAQQR